MTDPLYNVNIFHYPGGEIDHYIYATYSDWPTTATYSLPIYHASYFIARMPEAGIYATGSDYRAALENLLVLATASTTIDPDILPYKRTW